VIVAFDYPWLLAGAAVVALLAAGMILAGHARRRARLARYGSPEAIARLAPPDAARRPTGRAFRLALAALALGIAIAGPRWGESAAVFDVEGVDVVIALDASLSMLAEDERPNRLERMKQEVRRLRASSPGDRVALLAFAGRSYILSPLTADDGALELFLDNLDPSIVGQAGSSIALPMSQGLDLLLASRGDADRALVLMSDGEAFDDRDEAVKVAATLKDNGVLLVTVGFGTPGGATIPMPGTGGAEVKRDENGEIVITRADDDLLRALADAADGAFIASDATDKGNRIRRALAELESAARAESMRLNRPVRYQWFTALALVLLLFDAWGADGARWPRWLRLPQRPRRPRQRDRRARTRVGAGAGRTVVLLIAGVLGSASALDAQDATLERALEEHRAGRLLPAIRAYRAVVADGDRRPIVLYDLGTALLAADSLDAAIETLERATYAGDAELRTRARYNLGLAFLKRGMRLDGEGRTTALEGARRAFRNVLLERPGDRDAQWNYELALRAPTGGGGGGGGGPPPPVPPPPQPNAPMSQQQAEALLDAAAREERETQARRQRGNQPATAGRRDW
jgi:Ca-activated chloride channel family protein